MERNADWAERFKTVYKPLLGDSYDAFEAALSAPKSKHIRLNTTRGVDYFAECDVFTKYPSLPNFKNTYRVTEGVENITQSISFQTGGFYIMNPSSIVPAQALAARMPENPLMLDISAAPGGKTCALSDFIGRDGLIVANEISSSRLKSLHFNLEKYGCYNVKTISMDGRLLNKAFSSSFDGILLDAPCSNENKIFRDKTVQAQWSTELTERMAALQRQLVISAYECLKKGGYLMYSTCTLSLAENEDVVKFALEKFPDAELLPIPHFSGHGLSGISEVDQKVARIMPSAESVDGFFAALIRKKGELEPNTFCHGKIKPETACFFNEYFGGMPENASIYEAESKGYLETAGGHFARIPFKRRGLNVYKIAGKNLEPSAQALWEFGARVPKELRLNISEDDAIAYMKGFDIKMSPEYNKNLLFYKDIPVGYIKHVDGMLKNKLDRYFLYGKNIEW